MFGNDECIQTLQLSNFFLSKICFEKWRKMGKKSWFLVRVPGRYDLERPNPVFQENTRYGSQTWWFIDLILSTNSNFIPCSWVEEWRCCIELEVYEICTNASSQLKWFVPLTVPPRHQCHNWTSPHTFTSFQLSVIKSYQRGVNGRNAKVDLMFTKESSCRPFWSFLRASWTPDKWCEYYIGNMQYPPQPM